jgi:hypothetical protein
MLDVKDGTQQLKLKDAPPPFAFEAVATFVKTKINIKRTQNTSETLGFKVLLIVQYYSVKKWYR